MCHSRSGVIKAIFIICMMCSAKSAISASKTFSVLRDSTINQNTSLSMCLKVMRDGIRLEIPAFNDEKIFSNKALYIYGNEQWVIEAATDRLRCEYVGELYDAQYDAQLKSSGNYTFRNKLIILGDKCGPFTQYDMLCSNYLGKNIITDEDFDICLEKADTLRVLKGKLQICLGNFFSN